MKLALRLTIFCFVLFAAKNTGHSQLAQGAIAPDFTLPDIDGNYHNLYSYLSSGYGAIVDFSATWCGPCWSFHNSGTMEALQANYGGEIVTLFVEADGSTSEPCIYGPAGCSGGSIGNWTNVSFPVLNPPSSDAWAVNGAFAIGGYPTVYAISPDGRTYWVPNRGYGEFEAWILSFGLHKSTINVTGDPCGVRTVDLEPYNGYGTVTYNWSNGETTQDLINPPTGTYTVTISDSNNYTVEKGPIYVESGPDISLNLVSYQNVDCFGNSNGFAEYEASSLNPANLVYQWNTGDTTPSISNLDGGTYEVTVTDLMTGCTKSEYVIIEEPAALEIDPEIVTADCSGENGGVSLNLTGGSYPFYLYLNGDLYDIRNVVAAAPGEYQLEIYDDNGCYLNENILIDKIQGPEVDISEAQLLTCENDVVTLDADSSSVNHIVYAWYDTTDVLLGEGYTFDAFDPGVYILEVTDTLTECTEQEMIEIFANVSEPLAQTSVELDVTCSNTMVEISGEGSSMDNLHEYYWYAISGDIVGNTNTLTTEVSSAGEYVLQVINTENGCSTNDTLVVNENFEVPMIELVSQSVIDCENSNAFLEINDSEDYSYSWSTNDGIINGASENSSVEVSSSGVYTVEVTNLETGCSTEQEFTIEESLDLPEVEVTSLPTVDCNNSTVLVTVTENGDYEYIWTSVDGDIVAGMNSSSLEVQAGGEYLLEITSLSNGCSKNLSVTVPEALETPNASLVNLGTIDCINSTAGISIENNDDYVYEWSTVDGIIIGDVNSNELSASSAGTYTVLLTNSTNGCSTLESYIVEESLEQPMVSILSQGSLDCNVSEIEVVVDEDPNFSYIWTTADGSIQSGENTSSLIVSQTGTYDLIVVNNTNGCESTISTTIMGDFTTPSVDLVNIESFDCTTTGAIVEVETNDNLDYSWSTSDGDISGDTNSNAITALSPGTYNLIITNQGNGCTQEYNYDVEADVVAPLLEVSGDQAYCEGNSTQICIDTDGELLTWTLNGLELQFNETCLELTEAGVLVVEVSNSNGCKTSETITVTENMIPVISTSVDLVLDCNTPDAMIGVSIVGDPADFDISWTNAQSMDISSDVETSVSEAGMYTVIVTNKETGCSETSSVEVMIDETELPASDFESNINELTVLFNNTSSGQIDNSVWDFGDGSVSSAQNPTHTFPTSGYYNVCLTSINKCGENENCTEILALASIAYSYDKTDLDCYGDTDGSITLDYSGGLDPVTISWSGPNGFTSSEPTLSNLSAGDYVFEIIDDLNNVATEIVSIVEPTELMVDGIVSDAAGTVRGSIELEIHGGTGNYEVVWNTGHIGAYYGDLIPGEYEAVITDENGCMTSEIFTVGGITAINEIDFINDLSILPNPASDYFILRYGADRSEKLNLTIINNVGQSVYNTRLDGNTVEQRIDLDGLSEGIYFVRLTFENMITTRKVIVIN